MRRKRERNVTTKAKASPERKPEKIKRTRSKRRKQSTSSENESNEEIISGLVSEKVIDPDQSVEQSSKTEGSLNEPQDQVWQVKTPKGSGDGGEIQKLKICLTRPPSTPERAERSPHSKKKLTHATSSSDSTGVEVLDEKKKGKYRTKRSLCEVSDNSEKNETQNNDEESDLQTESSVVNTEVETASDKIEPLNQSLESKCNEEKVDSNVETGCNEKLESIPETTKLNDENIVSSDVKIDVNEEKSDSKNENTESSNQVESEDNEAQPESYKVTTADKENVNHTENDVASSELIITSAAMEDSITLNKSCQQESENETVVEKHEESESLKIVSSERKRSPSIDKSEILEIHAEESKVDISSPGLMESQKEDIVGDNNVCAAITQKDQVSNIQEITMENVVENTEPPQNEIKISTNKTDVVANLEEAVKEYSIETCCESSSLDQKKVLDQPECTQMNKEENGQNGSMNIIINRKRRWGSRPNKLSSQKSITISTDVLKEIIPDVKPVEFEEVIEEKKRYKRVEVMEKVERPILPKIVIDNTDNVEQIRDQEEQGSENLQAKEATNLATNRKISIVKDSDNIAVIRPPSPPRHKQSNILYITNLVRPFTLPQLKNLLQRTGRIVENGFWINRIKSKCFVIYEDEDQAVETRHALHGVTWPVSNPKTLHVDFSTQEEYEQAKVKEESEGAQNSTIPGTVEDWLREQDLKRERGEVDKPWERKTMREWDVGKNEKGVKLDKEKEKLRGDERSMEKRRHHSPERSPEPAKKFKKKEEAPAKLLDDLFRKTKTTPCIYWLPLSAETIAVKEEQRRQHMAEYERRMLEFRRTHRRH